jgi:hypothetical protein
LRDIELVLNSQPAKSNLISEPSGYQINLSGNASLRHLIARTNPTSIDPVTAPPTPAGTRDLVLTEHAENIGDPSTLRNLMLAGNAGEVTVPSGAYGDFSAADQTTFVLGVENSTVPAIYALQSLSLSGQAKVRLLGPVQLTVARTVTTSGSSVLGQQTSPQSLDVRLAGEAFQTSGASKVYASINAPSGSVTVSGDSQFFGSIKCNALASEGNALIKASNIDERLVVRHAAGISAGRVEASIWQLTGENFSLSSNATIVGDLYVPGTPQLVLNGVTSYSGIIVGSGNPDPTNYSIRLTGNSSLRFIKTQTNPVELPPVELPPIPSGTRDVRMNKASDSLGDPSTLRNLSLSGKAGSVPVPPGTYGAFSASGDTAFVFGSSNSGLPTIHNHFTLSRESQRNCQRRRIACRRIGCLLEQSIRAGNRHVRRC